MKLLNLLFILILLMGCELESEDKLNFNAVAVSQLNDLKSKPKFHEDTLNFYPGAPDEVTRLKAEAIINSVVTELLAEQNADVKENFLWLSFEKASVQFSQMDSEEFDRGLAYMEEIMDIFSIESSGGRLNKWRYGFDPNNVH